MDAFNGAEATQPPAVPENASAASPRPALTGLLPDELLAEGCQPCYAATDTLWQAMVDGLL
jgi:hypothetical protein